MPLKIFLISNNRQNFTCTLSLSAWNNRVPILLISKVEHRLKDNIFYKTMNHLKPGVRANHEFAVPLPN